MQAGELLAGRFRLIARLGEGAMGEVWSATEEGGRDVAIKLLHDRVAGIREVRQRFVREAKISTRLEHPNIVETMEFLELPGGGLGLVMERLEGVTLKDALRSDPPFSARDLCAILLDVASALGAAHAAGVVHRDVKPANIFLHQDNVSGLVYAKVVDFGVSKSVTSDSLATNAGALLGSPRYMSPEQIQGARSADHRTDIWAVGVILFEALTGQWPHRAENFPSLLLTIGTEPPRSIDEVAPALPAPVRALVRSCLAPVEVRVATANALGDALRSLLDLQELGDLPLRHRLADADEPSTTEESKSLTPDATFASSALGRSWKLGDPSSSQGAVLGTLKLGSPRSGNAGAPAPATEDPVPHMPALESPHEPEAPTHIMLRFDELSLDAPKAPAPKKGSSAWEGRTERMPSPTADPAKQGGPQYGPRPHWQAAPPLAAAPRPGQPTWTNEGTSDAQGPGHHLQQGATSQSLVSSLAVFGLVLAVGLLLGGVLFLVIRGLTP